MEKIQLKMKLLNVAVTEGTWRAFDLLVMYMKKMGIEDENESAIIGCIVTAGIEEVTNCLEKIQAKDPKILDKLNSFEIDKDGINEMFNITV